MSSETRTNVQFAASNLSLADLEALAEPKPEPTQRDRLRKPANLGPQPVSTATSKKTSNSPQIEPNEDFVVVSIPTVESGNEIGESIEVPKRIENSRPVEEGDVRLQRLPQSIHPIPFVEQLKKFAEESKPHIPSESKKKERNEGLSGLNLKMHGAPKADISERPDDWLPDRDSGEKRTGKKAKPLDTPKQAFSDLTAQVLEQFPLGPSSVLLITDVDGRSSGDSVAYQLAIQLGAKNVGRVLLIDSHFEERRLSERLSLGFENGLADILSTNKSLNETLCETECSNVDFLPVGSDRMCKRRCSNSTWLSDNIRSLREDYQFVVVCAGNVFHRSTAMWGQHCDASYMAIELGASNQTIAKSGVIRLQQYGARLMGCVVTDVAA